jgi:serine phosphatase RsbU (regulator of sigma subunit)
MNQFSSNTDGEGTFILEALATERRPREERVHDLVVVSGLEPGRRYRVTQKPVVFGRSSASDACIRDQSLSKRHCQVQVVDGALEVTDLGSTNGTCVDGERVAGRAIIAIESMLEIGDQVLKHEFRYLSEVQEREAISEDLGSARRYVLSMLPAPLDEPGLRIDHEFVPSSMLGGDLFGHHLLDEHTRAIYLLDVSGHGVAAAMHSVSVLNVLRHGTLPGADFRSPASVLSELNRVFQMDAHGGLYFTLWYGVHDARSGVLAHGSAGHPPALLQAGGELVALKAKGMPIGLYPDAPYQEESVAVPASAVLHVFSDGVFEVRTPEGRDWRLDDLKAALLSLPVESASRASDVRRAVERATGVDRWEDDFSIMVARFS